MRKLLAAALLPLLFLTACAGDAATSEVRWAQAASAYNAAVRQAVAARKPCVEFGAEAPDCLIPDQHYPVVNMAIQRGSAIVDAVGDASPTGGTTDALLAIAAEILAAIPVKR